MIPPIGASSPSFPDRQDNNFVQDLHEHCKILTNILSTPYQADKYAQAFADNIIKLHNQAKLDE